MLSFHLKCQITPNLFAKTCSVSLCCCLFSSHWVCGIKSNFSTLSEQVREESIVVPLERKDHLESESVCSSSNNSNGHLVPVCKTHSKICVKLISYSQQFHCTDEEIKAQHGLEMDHVTLVHISLPIWLHYISVTCTLFCTLTIRSRHSYSQQEAFMGHFCVLNSIY